MQQLNFRRATFADLSTIIQLLADDDFGTDREKIGDKLDQRYEQAFAKIDKDPNQYLMVVLSDNNIIGTCHLTLMPSLTYMEATRMQIEAVRIAQEYKGQKIGEWMMQQALEFVKENQVKIVQLTTNKLRPEAKHDRRRKKGVDHPFSANIRHLHGKYKATYRNDSCGKNGDQSVALSSTF